MPRLTALLGRIFRWDRSDSFVLEAILGIFAILVLAFVVLSVTDAAGVTCGITGHPTTADCPGPGFQATPKQGARPFPAAVTLADGSQLHPATVNVIFKEITGGQRWGLLAASLLAGVGLLVVLGLIYRVVESVRRDRAFAPGNARILMWAAGVLLVTGMGSEIAYSMVRIALLDRPELRDVVQVDATMSFLPLLASLVVAFVAEVFRRGSALQAELEEVV